MISYALIPSALCAASLKAYIEHGQPTGDFLLAVLSNDLAGAACRADSTNYPALREYCWFLHNEAPPGCHGSPAKVEAWIAKGGLRGPSK